MPVSHLKPDSHASDLQSVPVKHGLRGLTRLGRSMAPRMNDGVLPLRMGMLPTERMRSLRMSERRNVES